MTNPAIGKEVPCRGCGAPIRFIKMRTGGSMPVEATPFKMVFVTGPSDITAGNLSAGILANVYEPHWANCEKAEDFKK